MSANRLFVVCQHHPTLDQALCLAERFQWGMPYEPTQSLIAREWFERHARCGRGKTCDHFKLAIHRPADHDKPVESVGHAVKLTLVKDAVEQEVKRINGDDHG